MLEVAPIAADRANPAALKGLHEKIASAMGGDEDENS
jgi:hypothetical protein